MDCRGRYLERVDRAVMLAAALIASLAFVLSASSASAQPRPVGSHRLRGVFLAQFVNASGTATTQAPAPAAQPVVVAAPSPPVYSSPSPVMLPVVDPAAVSEARRLADRADRLFPARVIVAPLLAAFASGVAWLGVGLPFLSSGSTSDASVIVPTHLVILAVAPLIQTGMGAALGGRSDYGMALLGTLIGVGVGMPLWFALQPLEAGLWTVLLPIAGGAIAFEIHSAARVNALRLSTVARVAPVVAPLAFDGRITGGMVGVSLLGF